MSEKQEFGILDINMSKRSQQLELEKLFTPAPPWSEKESTKAAVNKRRAEIANDYEAFDRLYFPPESYGGQYSPSNEFHALVAGCCQLSGRKFNLIVGPHDHAKSATVYKVLVWLALTGKKHFIGLASETLETPLNIISAISQYMHQNERIRHDFPDLSFVTNATEKLHITTLMNTTGTVFLGYSEEKSPRGKNVNLFYRFDLMVIEDLENRESSLTEAAVNKRIQKLAEFQSALSDAGCAIMTANNFDDRCVTNTLLEKYKADELDESWTVWNFPAWGNYYTRDSRFRLHNHATNKATKLRQGPLWKQRYPAKTEVQLRKLLRPFDDATWLSSYQGTPQPPAGDYFPRSDTGTYEYLPDDVVAIINADQNLARKGKGDRTCLGALGFSPSMQKLYVFGVQYHSYADSNKLLSDMRGLLHDCYNAGISVLSVGMEGHVTQESHWQMHLENYMTIHEVLMPPVTFHRYQIELEAKNTQLFWTSGKILLPEGFTATVEGRQWIDHVSEFTGRKLPGRKDDAPDWLIKSVRMLLELNLITDYSGPLKAAVYMRKSSSGRWPMGNRNRSMFKR